MGEITKIEWTDHTFNPWMGCSKVHEGCTNCYAETLMDTRWGKVEWGPNGTRVMASPDTWRNPIKWNRAAEKAGERRRVFCASLADVFEDWQGKLVASHGYQLYVCTDIRRDWCGAIGDFPSSGRPATMDDARRKLFELIDATPWLDWLLLTKRPENIRRMWAGSPGAEAAKADGWKVHGKFYRLNVALITSVSNQATADKQIPELLKCRDLASVMGISAEPLLGPIDLATDCTVCDYCGRYTLDKESWECPCGKPLIQDAYTFAERLDWVIVGGESGHGARPCNVEWVRGLRDQCATAAVPCFVKQLGATAFDGGCTAEPFDGSCGHACGMADGRHYLRLSDSKGGDWSEWPEDLRVRQFPAFTEASE